jgi:KUP system potassium uptake protein
MPTIQIADEPHPKDDLSELKHIRRESRTSSWVTDVEARSRLRRVATTESFDGIYNIRSRSAAPPPRAATWRSSDDDPGLRKDGDFKQRQVRADLDAGCEVLMPKGILRQNPDLAGVPVYRRHLR